MPVVECGQTALVAKRVETRVLHHLVDAMITHVVEGQRRLLTQCLLKFKVPLLVTWVLDPPCDRIKRGWTKARHAVLNAGKRPTIGECGAESSIALGRQLCLIVGYSRRQRTTCNVEPHLQRRVAQQLIGDVAGEGVGEQAEAAPNDRAMQAKRRPGEAAARLPINIRVVRQNLVLPRDNGLVVRLVRVMRNVEKVPTEVRKAVGLADRIGKVLAAQRESELEIGLHVPLVLPVKGQVIESN